MSVLRYRSHVVYLYTARLNQLQAPRSIAIVC